MQKIRGVFLVVALLYIAIALYGKHSTCSEAGGVLAVGLGSFVCVSEVGH